MKIKPPKIYVLTDTHFGHLKLLVYANRTQNFAELILEQLNCLRHGDVLIHLGDFCIGNDKFWHEEFFRNIPIGVTTILVRGNHDKKSNSWYIRNGWSFVCKSFTDEYMGVPIVFSHRPTNLSDDFKGINIHGHTHGNAHRDFEHNMFYNEKHREIALEKTGYGPLLLDNIIKQK